MVPTFTLGTHLLDNFTWTATNIGHAFPMLAVETFLTGTGLRTVITVAFDLKFLVRTAVLRTNAVTVDPYVPPFAGALSSAARNAIVVMLLGGVTAFANFLGFFVFRAALGARGRRNTLIVDPHEIPFAEATSHTFLSADSPVIWTIFKATATTFQILLIYGALHSADL